MNKLKLEQFFNITTFFVNVHHKNLLNVTQSEELGMAAQRIAIGICNMLTDLTQITPEDLNVNGHVRNCIDAINENKAIKQDETVIFDLSTDQAIEIWNGIQSVTKKEESVVGFNDTEILEVIFIARFFAESIHEKFLEEKCSEIDFESCS